MPQAIRVLGIMLALGAASAAPAKPKPEAPVGTRIPRDLELSPLPEARATLSDFARCAVRKRRDLAVQFILDTKINVADQYLKLADPKCMMGVADRIDADVYLTLPRDIMRFAIAEALMRADLGSFDPALIKLAQPLQYSTLDPADYVPKPGKKYKPKELAELQEAKVIDQARIAFQRYGECVARNEPLNVRLLTFSKPDSIDEVAALKALMPKFSDCLTAGQQFKTNKTMMRGTLALAYYRLARAPRATVATAK